MFSVSISYHDTIAVGDFLYLVLKVFLKTLFCDVSRAASSLYIHPEVYTPENKHKHLKPCSVLSQFSPWTRLYFSVFIVHRLFISKKKLKYFRLFHKAARWPGCFSSSFYFPLSAVPHAIKKYHRATAEILSLPLHRKYLSTHSGGSQRVVCR